MKSGPHLPQLEKALAQKRRPNTAINKLKKKKSYKRQRTFYINKRFKTARRYNNYKHYIPNERPLKHMKQKLTGLKGEIVPK